MNWLFEQSLPPLPALPVTLPCEAAASLELEQGIIIFRAAPVVQDRVEELLQKQRTAPLTAAEEQELDQYEEIDHYLSFVNRVLRNLHAA